VEVGNVERGVGPETSTVIDRLLRNVGCSVVGTQSSLHIVQ
jgi:hypothetical protein